MDHLRSKFDPLFILNTGHSLHRKCVQPGVFMDLYIDRDELIRGLARVQGIVERRSTNLALSHVLLSAKEGRLRITATDTMSALVADYSAQVEQEGELSVDAHTLYQVARSLSEPTVHIKSGESNRLNVSCGSARFNVVGMSSEDFPPLPTRDEKSSLTVSSAGLKRVIDETIFSISSDDNRYGLNGAHMEEVTAEGGDPRVRLVTTDGSRLSYSEIEYSGEFGMGRRMLLPRKALSELKKLMDGRDHDWTVSFGERSATLSTEGLTLMVRLVDGEFPPYRQVLPTGRKRRVTFERDAFSTALKHVAIMAADRNHSVRFAFESDKLVLTAQNVDAGDVREEIPVEMDGEPVYTGFNVRYFQDILSATKSEQLVLELGDPLDPCIARIPERDDCLFVVMPMRLD